MTSCRRASGLALIEALMALAVMAFGMLALVGVQSNLRQNADISRQRSEAIRIAQEEIEKWRGFTSVYGTGPLVYDGLQSDPPGAGRTVSSEYGMTAQFKVAKTVFPALSSTKPDFSMKTLTVDVTWVDRNSEAQNVRLSTALHGVAPELAGTLSIPAEGAPTSRAGRRSRAIPWDAVRLDNGVQSAWRPPQGSEGTVVWKFSNDTGLIVGVCALASGLPLTSANLAGNCNDSQFAQLLSGYVNFADRHTLASANEAVAPSGHSQPVQVWVHKTAPSDEMVAPGSGCFTEPPSYSRSYVAYYCAVPVSSAHSPPDPWSGYSFVMGSSITGLPGDLTVCRYTRFADDRAVNDTPGIKNIEHPRAYLNVNEPLSNQNFLAVGVFYTPDPSALNCPQGSPLPLDTTTYPQPASAP
jgi:hypothetical protein